MISLKNKITKNFIAGILSSILVFSILVFFMIGRVSNDYIEKTQYIKPDKIKNEFQYLIAENNSSLLTARLTEFSQIEDVNIEVTNIKNESVIKIDGRKNQDDRTWVTKNYRLISPDTYQYIGQLKVTYEKQNGAAKELREQFSKSVTIALIFSLLLGFVIAMLLSANITKPIVSISNATLKIKDGDYDIDLEESMIKELNTLNQNIKYLSSNLKNQEIVRKQYAQDISHELRTPLTNLQLYIEAIKDDIIQADQETLDIILNEVLRLSDLVKNLNKTFQDNIEYLNVKKQTFDLSEHLSSISKSFLARATAENIELVEKIDEGIMISSYKEKITQIMHNLITNAFKAIGKNGRIVISLYEIKGDIFIKIADNGVGISKEKLPMIFGRFYRIDDARNTKENGLGLGLSISKNFVESLGGIIKVESKLNKGTTFTIIFSR